MKQETSKKTKSNKKYLKSASDMAELCGCSESYVKKLRLGLVETKTDKAKLVMAVDEYLYDGTTALLKEVERILQPHNKSSK